jgi:hypothetical protein
MYVIVTIVNNSKGTEIIHAYGTYPTRNKAQKDLNVMLKNMEFYYPGQHPGRYFVRKVISGPEE